MGIQSLGVSTEIGLGVRSTLFFCNKVFYPRHLETWAGDGAKRGSSSSSLREFWALHTAKSVRDRARLNLPF